MMVITAKAHSEWKPFIEVHFLPCKMGRIQKLYHFYDHSDPNDPLLISNPVEAPFDPQYREFFLQGALSSYRVPLLHFMWNTKTIQ